MESLCFGVLICETGRCYTKEQMMTVPTVVLCIIIIPYQLFLFKAATCAACPYFVPATAHGEVEKRESEFVSCDMIHACRQFKLRARRR